MTDHPQRKRTIRETDVQCPSCGNHYTTIKPHINTCTHQHRYKKRRVTGSTLNTMNNKKITNDKEALSNVHIMSENSEVIIEEPVRGHEPLDYQIVDDSLVINWSVATQSIIDGCHLNCRTAVSFARSSWIPFIKVHEDSLSIGITFAHGETQPFVHLSIELEHRRKTSSIKKNAVKVFSLANASFGWKFSREHLLDTDLDLIGEFLKIKYNINLLTQENDANVVVEHKPVLKKHSTIESRLLRSWMLENFITDKAVEHLLKILTSPDFVASRLAPSVHLLKECDPAFIPPIDVRTTTIAGVKVHYYSPVDIWQILLADPHFTTNWRLNFDRNNDVIEHPCNTDGWQDIERSLARFRESHKLLLPSFFCDEYLQHNTSQKYVNSILMTISNASKDEQLQIDRKYLISTVPDGVDINAVLQHVLVPSLMLLEEGQVSSYFAVTKKNEKFCGTIFNMLGDHMGQIAISGLKSATCQMPSRYSLTPLEDMEKVVPLANKTWRTDATKLWNSVENAPSAEERDNIKLKNGLSHRPTLLDLSIFANSFYKRFGNCLLHNAVVGGNLVRHILSIGEKYGEDLRKGINSTITRFKFPVGSEKIKSLFYDKVTRVPNGENYKEVKLSQQIGKHLEIVFAFILVWIQSMQLVSDDDMKCLANHIDLYYLLKTTTKWKRSDLDPINGSLIKKITEVKTAILKCFPQGEYNWRTPKFESMDAWPLLIRYLGPPAFQSTDTWEATHLPNKADSMLSNHHAVELDVLKKQMCQLLFKHHQIFTSSDAKATYEAAVQQKNRSDAPLEHAFGPKSCNPNAFRYEILHMQRVLELSEPEPTKAFKCSGFVWHGLRVRVGQCFEFSSPLMPDAKLFGELLEVVRFETDNSSLITWLRITLYRGRGQDLVGNCVLQNNKNVMIPLGAGYSFTRIVHLYLDQNVAKINKFALL